MRATVRASASSSSLENEIVSLQILQRFLTHSNFENNSYVSIAADFYIPHPDFLSPLKLQTGC